MRRRLALCLVLWGVAGLAGAQEAPLRAGVIEGMPPFVIRDAKNSLSGFTIDLFRAIGARLKRPIAFVAAPEPELIRGLAAGHFDLLAGPILATPEAAADMLLTEGYIWSEYQFAGPGGAPLITLAGLRGRRLSVAQNTPYAEWAGRRAQALGFSVQLHPTASEALLAVARHDADAGLTGSPMLRYAISQHAGLAAGLALPETRAHEVAAFRESDTELRDDVEDALHCLKQDGSVARISTTWFGAPPDAEDLENLVIPGYGVPGLAGYDPKPRKLVC